MKRAASNPRATAQAGRHMISPEPERSRRDGTRSRIQYTFSNQPMPELPEVETIARGLANRVTGDVVESVWLGQKKEPLKSPASEIADALEHSRILAVRRMGKHIVFDLEQDHVARPPSAAPRRTSNRKPEGKEVPSKAQSIAQPEAGDSPCPPQTK